ncbi:MAG: hypothetical protein K2G42_03215 [Clostridia bacterium]|nr:hypothetical protein [Clostridia bacterium]
MKKNIIKSLTPVILLSIMISALVGCCNCPKDNDNSSQNVVPQYDTIFSNAIRQCSMSEVKNLNYDFKIEIVTSLSDLEKFNILGEGYTEEYFEYNVILLINFIFASSDDNIEFKNLAIKDHKFYPIFETYSPIQNEWSTADIRNRVFVVTAPIWVMNYEFGETLVINRRDVTLTRGSCYHNSITSVFN